MTRKRLTILGSTGSIGTNTLDVVARYPEAYEVFALAARSSVDALAEQIERFRPRVAVVYDPAAAEALQARLPAHTGTTVRSGLEGLLEVATAPEVQQVVAGMVGAVGLRPAYAAIDAGKQVGLANKETLVLAGELMVRRAAETGAVLLPMDSEHNAIFQCLQGARASEVDRLILTASGGPFRDRPAESFGDITRAEALAHPNWAMGPKITIDSATMMNKGLEVVEARWIFGVPPERIDVVIHRQSIVHSLVEFVDGSVLAQLGLPDMRTPIAHCLAWPERLPLDLPRLNLAEVGRLDFQAVTRAKYPCLYLALECLKWGAGAPAALNGANEVVVAAYLEKEFPFTRIGDTLEDVVRALREVLGRSDCPAWLRHIGSVDDAVAADAWGRRTAETLLRGNPPESPAMAGRPSSQASSP